MTRLLPSVYGMPSPPCHDVVSVDLQAGQAKRTPGSVHILSQGGRCLAAWLTSQHGTHLGQEIEHQGIDRPGGMRSRAGGRMIRCPRVPQARGGMALPYRRTDEQTKRAPAKGFPRRRASVRSIGPLSR